MFTLLDLVELVIPIVGVLWGFVIGARFGIVPGIVCAGIGLILGRILGKLPLTISIYALKRCFRKKTTEDLRKELRKEDCLIPNVILHEILSRGDDTSEDLEIVLNKLESVNSDERSRGWVALKSAFPNIVKMMPDYNFYDSPELCKQKVDKLRVFLAENKSNIKNETDNL